MSTFCNEFVIVDSYLIKINSLRLTPCSVDMDKDLANSSLAPGFYCEDQVLKRCTASFAGLQHAVSGINSLVYFRFCLVCQAKRKRLRHLAMTSISARWLM